MFLSIFYRSLFFCERVLNLPFVNTVALWDFVLLPFGRPRLDPLKDSILQLLDNFEVISLRDFRHSGKWNPLLTPYSSRGAPESFSFYASAQEHPPLPPQV